MTNDTNLPAERVVGTNIVDDDMAALMRQHQHESDFNKADLGTPFVQIVQAMSKIAKRSDPAYVEGAQEGLIYDTLTKRLRNRAAFIPCKFQVEYTEWAPNQGPIINRWGTDRSGYDAARKYVHNGKFVEWGPRYVMKESWEETGPGASFNEKTDPVSIITPAGVYYGLLLDEDGTSLECVLSLTGTQAKKARRFNDLINALELVDSKGEPYQPAMFSRIYGLSTVAERSDENSWMGWVIEPGPLTLQVKGGRQLFMKAIDVRKRAMEGKIVTMQTDDAQEAQRGDGGEGRAAAPAQETQRRSVRDNLDDDIPF